MPPSRAIICDLDGTLAQMQGRGIHEYDRVHEDAIQADILDLLWVVSKGADTSVIIITARPAEKSRELTEYWLDRFEVPYDHLYMRPEGDDRHDNEVKRDIYTEHVEPNYDVWFVLEDRNRVVEMWRDLGLLCFQVAEGDF